MRAHGTPRRLLAALDDRAAGSLDVAHYIVRRDGVVDVEADGLRLASSMLGSTGSPCGCNLPLGIRPRSAPQYPHAYASRALAADPRPRRVHQLDRLLSAIFFPKNNQRPPSCSSCS
jgi:hypothetical protein